MLHCTLFGHRLKLINKTKILLVRFSFPFFGGGRNFPVMENDSIISHAFILGAGLGTRLRPLTSQLPKPLVPVWNAPLITYAFDHLIHDSGTSRFIVNTHHAAKKYSEEFPENSYRDRPITFRHEEVLLDTAGGLDNIRDLLPEDESFWVYNGDILTDLPLEPAVEAHRASGNLVTLILRSRGPNPNVSFDEKTGQVTDMRNVLGVHSLRLFQFTGIYLVAPRFLSYLKSAKIESVVMPLLKAIQSEHKVGGIVIDEGRWSDLGDVSSYLDALDLLAEGDFPAYGLESGKRRIDPSASIDPTSRIDEKSSIGPGAVIGELAEINRSVIWPGAKVDAGEHISGKVALSAPP